MSGAPGRVALVLASSTGGVGRHVRSLAGFLVAAGYRVDVYGPAATEELFGFRGAGAGFRPVEIPARPHPIRDVRALAALGRGLRASPPDVVHAHGLRAGLVAGLARRPGPDRPPLVVTWHNLLTGRGRVLGVLEAIVARSADVTLAASDDLAARALALGATDVRPAPVAAPMLARSARTAAQIRAELGADGHPLVLSVGRLHPQKRFDVLIDAAAHWSGAGSPRVVIAGCGPDERALREQAASRRAEVKFLGYRNDVHDLLAGCDIAVVTSDWEARQLFAQEALRAGRPLVATAVGAIPALVRDGALLVPAGDPAAVAAAVEALLADPVAAAALAARGSAVAAGWPDEATVARQAGAVYAELTGLFSGAVMTGLFWAPS